MGYIESWILHKEECSQCENGVRILKELPQVVFVRFQEFVVGEGAEARWEDCKWRVGDLAPGIYPIETCRRRWFLDQKRKFPVLPVHRQQLPLAPHFSMTAHAAQGQTLLAAIVDLQLGRGVSLLASYIAMTRMRCRGDLLIYRDFDWRVFAAGSAAGPSTLLKVLRGESIDWDALEAEYTPRRTCAGCAQERYKHE